MIVKFCEVKFCANFCEVVLIMTMAAVMMTGPGGDYVDDDGYFTCAVSVQHKVGPYKVLSDQNSKSSLLNCGILTRR